MASKNGRAKLQNKITGEEGEAMTESLKPKVCDKIRKIAIELVNSEPSTTKQRVAVGSLLIKYHNWEWEHGPE